MAEEKPLYEVVGGDNTIRRIVPIFYRKLLDDDTVNAIFHKIDMSKQI